jgi:hypothetical protein
VGENFARELEKKEGKRTPGPDGGGAAGGSGGGGSNFARELQPRTTSPRTGEPPPGSMIGSGGAKTPAAATMSAAKKGAVPFIDADAKCEASGGPPCAG